MNSPARPISDPARSGAAPPADEAGPRATGVRGVVGAVRRGIGGTGEVGEPRGRAWIVRQWALTRVITFLILIPENNILGDVR